MKKISILLSIAAAALAIASCETYKVAEPDMTQVSWLDGHYVAFAYDPADTSTPVSVFDINITNTTEDAADRAWVTIADLDFTQHSAFQFYASQSLQTAAYDYGRYYLYAIRFDVACSKTDQTFSISGASGVEPTTCYNPFLEQGYYTEGRFVDEYDKQTVSVTGGKVVTDGVTTKTGYKTDSIEFTISLTDDTGATATYFVKGIKNTGWAEDMEDYAAWVDAL